MRDCVIKRCKSELVEICSTKNPSILRSSKGTEISQLRYEDIANEFSRRIPTIWKIVTTLLADERIAAVPICNSIVFGYNKHMSALAHKNGLLLRQHGAKEEVYKHLFTNLVSQRLIFFCWECDLLEKVWTQGDWNMLLFADLLRIISFFLRLFLQWIQSKFQQVLNQSEKNLLN